MIKKIVLILAALPLIISLPACNTMQGFGQDVSKAGSGISQEAQEHKKY
jgi:predicted small secreted protein